MVGNKSLIKIDYDISSIISTMQIVEDFSSELKTTSFIWGGFSTEIYRNEISREHDDIDYLTISLYPRIEAFRKLFKVKRWDSRIVGNGDLVLKKNGLSLHFGNIEISDSVKWMHNGENGHVEFPRIWLINKPMCFLNVKVHVVAPEFEYVIKSQPKILNPSWVPRGKDAGAKLILEKILREKNVNLNELHCQVKSWSK
jgi:hypothetical protein